MEIGKSLKFSVAGPLIGAFYHEPRKRTPGSEFSNSSHSISLSNQVGKSDPRRGLVNRLKLGLVRLLVRNYMLPLRE